MKISGLLSDFFGVVEIPDHHFFKGLVTPGDPSLRIGIVEIGFRVIKGSFAVNSRAGRQEHRGFQAIFGLPIEIVVGDVQDHFALSIWVNQAIAERLAPHMHVRAERKKFAIGKFC